MPRGSPCRAPAQITRSRSSPPSPRPTTTRPSCGGGSDARWCGSRHATFSASPTSEPSAPSSLISREACLGAALEIAAPTVPIAVLAMGKLGGSELNYASDVDVLFVHDGSSTEAERAARALLSVMTTPTADGIVFRTDADLRPEGRSGALSRSIDAFEAYWDRWAQTWELQALIKARPVAGDPDLGALFVERAEPFVWPEVMDPDAVRDIRAMKSRTEEMLRLKGVHGARAEAWTGRHPRHRVRGAAPAARPRSARRVDPVANTLEALEQLAAAGYVASRRRRSARHRLRVAPASSSTASSCRTSSRCTRCPPTIPRARRSPASSGSATSLTLRRSSSSTQRTALIGQWCA